MCCWQVSLLAEGQALPLTELSDVISKTLCSSSSKNGSQGQPTDAGSPGVAAAAAGAADATQDAAAGEGGPSVLVVRNLIQEVASRKSYGLQDGEADRVLSARRRRSTCLFGQDMLPPAAGSLRACLVCLHPGFDGFACGCWGCICGWSVALCSQQAERYACGAARAYLTLLLGVCIVLSVCLPRSGALANVDALEDATADFHWCWELRTLTGLPKAAKQHADAARKHRKQVWLSAAAQGYP